MGTHPGGIRVLWVSWGLLSWDRDQWGEWSLSPEDGCGTAGLSLLGLFHGIVPMRLCPWGCACSVVPMGLCH